jgi:hypothetical protein
MPPPQRTDPPSARLPSFLRDHLKRVIQARAGRRARAKPSAQVADASRQKHSGRFALLAAALALAAALGSGVGSFGMTALAHILPGPASAAATETADIQSLKRAVAQIGSELAAVKVKLDQSSRAANAQLVKFAERLERAERALAEPVARLAKITESLARVEQRLAAMPPTPSGEVTGSAPAAASAAVADKTKPPIIDGWVLRRVYDGIALIEGRRGVVEIEPGETLPGVGRIEEIRRQEGQWVVVTNKGLIVPR